jgi:hypothetical protein
MLAVEFNDYGEGWTKDYYVLSRLGNYREFGISTYS